MEKAYTFPRTMRLGGRGTFTNVFEQGIKQSKGPLAVIAIPIAAPRPRLGISIGRRVGSAPKRNRIKRLLREAFRLMQHDLPRGYDVVVVVRPHDTASLADYQRLLGSLIVKIHQATEKKQGGTA